ncbi:MAG: rhomboid family intramembrane serine protease [Bacteroidota bacterium]
MITEFRPGRFQILPTIIKNLLIINVLVFLAQLVFDGTAGSGSMTPSIGNVANFFALHNIESPLFKPWQIITHMFMHGSLGHIFGNMFALWMFGSVLENLWGPRKFLIFYMICGIGAAAVHLGWLSWEYHSLLNDFAHFKDNPSPLNFKELMENKAFGSADPHRILELTRNWPSDPEEAKAYASAVLDSSSVFIQEMMETPTLGASGAVFGCLAAFGYLFPNTYIYIYFLVPLKAKWVVLMYMAYELLMVLQNSAGGIARFAHLGGALVGFLLVYFWNRTNRKSFY